MNYLDYEIWVSQYYKNNQELVSKQQNQNIDHYLYMLESQFPTPNHIEILEGVVTEIKLEYPNHAKLQKIIYYINKKRKEYCQEVEYLSSYLLK